MIIKDIVKFIDTLDETGKIDETISIDYVLNNIL